MSHRLQLEELEWRGKARESRWVNVVIWIHSREALDVREDSGLWALGSQEPLKALFGHSDVIRATKRIVNRAVK